MNKSNQTKLIRHIIQLLSFLFLPGLFVLTLNSVASIYQAILGGSFQLEAQKKSILILLSVFPVTILWGRFFCSYLCAFGSMQEAMSGLAKRLKIKQLKISPKNDRFMKKLKYLVLILLFVLWTFKISYDQVNPWYVFGLYSSVKGWTDLSALFSIGGALLFLILALSLVSERFFCRYLCPLGAIFTLVSFKRLFRIKKKGDSCINCKRCSRSCPMMIDVAGKLETKGSLVSGECIDCFKCSENCPKDCLITNSKETMSGTAAALLITGMYFAGTIPAGKAISVSEISETIVSTNETKEGLYTDGTYTGEGEGFRGTTQVSVTVEEGMIKEIVVESYDDDEEFFSEAESTVINEILVKQTTNVDVVSGATYSSKGIMEAVADALMSAQTNQDEAIETEAESAAMESTEETETETEYVKESESETDTAIDNENNEFKDGSYSGSGSGRNGSIEVSVTVSDGKITSIEITSSSEDTPYLSKASAVIDSVIEEQSVDVDTVSGATMSSNGILEAIADALDLSYTNTNSQIGHGGHGGFGGHGGH